MFRRIIAGILAFVFVFIAVPLGILWATYRTFVDRDFYSGDFIDATYELLLSEIPRNIDFEELSMVDEEEMREIIKDVVQKEDLQIFVNDVLDQIESAKIEDKKVHVIFPLDWISEKSKPLAAALTDLMYEHVPICADGDSDMEVTECIPEDYAEIDFNSEIERMLDENLFSQLPAEFAFDLDVNVAFEGSVAHYLSGLVNAAFLIGLLVLVVLLLIMSLVIWSPFIQILKWITSAVVMSSMFLTFYFGVFLLLPSLFYEDFFDEVGDELRIRAIENFYDSVFGSFAKSILIYVGPVFIISYIPYKYCEI
ncbi:MAG: hypothetical protein O3B47_04540, partial [bacterium]|nr:hypothetical protein [bacterium]